MTDKARNEQDASDITTVRAQVVWLEERGWKIGDGGLLYPTKAADIGLTHSRAFTVEARSGDASSTLTPAREPGSRAWRTRWNYDPTKSPFFASCRPGTRGQAPTIRLGTS